MIENCIIYFSLVFLIPIIGFVIIILIRYLRNKNPNTESSEDINERSIVEFEEKYSFIPEKPIDGSDINNPYEFGHPEIIESLYKMIGAVVKGNSLTIGLFGDWGSGKSSIASGLEKKLLSNKIPTVLFDVWKHEGDGLRRTFLKFLVKELKIERYGKKYLNKKFDLSGNLDKPVKSHKIVNPKLKEVLNLFINFSLFFIGFFLVAWGLKSLLFGYKQISFDELKILISLILSSLPISYITKLLLKSSEGFLGNKVEIIDEKFTDPIQFEEEFKSILIELTKSTDKLVIIFDNLDRVSGQKSLELISTIKTFLEPADKEVNGIDVIFLLPCDELAIEKHLAALNNSNDTSKRDRANYSREYLRKFFNTILRIPKFDLSELVDFTYSQLNQTKVPQFNNKELASLIGTQFRSNPRQIIQFINILLSKFILFRERENSLNGGLDKGFTNENTLQIAKFLMLEQRFSEILQLYITFQENNINQITSIKNKYLDVEDKIERNDRQSEFSKFEMFLSQTRPIVINNLDIFINTRESKFHSSFPNSNSIISILEEDLTKIIMEGKTEDERLKQYKEYLDTIIWETYGDDFDSLIVNLLDSKKFNEPELCRFINSILNFFEHYNKVKISDRLIKIISSYLGLESYLASINYINEPSLVFKHLFQNSNDNKELQRRIIKQLSVMVKSRKSDGN